MTARRPPGPPELSGDAHKGDAGRVLVIAGTVTMPGAAILVVRAAQRAGAGLVSLGCLDREMLGVVPGAAPEAVLVDLSDYPVHRRLDEVLAERADDARAVGPGLARGARARRLVRDLLDDDFAGATALDADGLNVLAGEPELLARAAGAVVVTPHPLEAARLLGREVPRDREGRVAAARELAERSGAVCVLKGAGTVVTDGDTVFVNDTGNPGMATGGAGDVLTGILAAYLAPCRRDDRWRPLDAAVAAVWVHGHAGDLAAAELGRRALVASDLVAWLPAAQRAWEARS